MANSGNADVIVLPEMFNTGFSMESSKLAEPHDGPSVQWMKQQAELYNAAVVGSVITEQDSHYYNRLYWVFPDGTFKCYDKRHLFRMAQEHEHFTGGTERRIVEYKGWKICPLICYDLRFPVWSRNNVQFDVLVYVANWPAARTDAWSTLLKARAIENQCYVIGCNRVGEDGKGIGYAGASVIHDPKGVELTHQNGTEQVLTASINFGELADFRTKFPVDKDRDKFEIID